MNTIIKQMWNQRKANGWIFFELILIFVVIWIVIDPIYVITYQRKCIKEGFEPENLYYASINMYSPMAGRFDFERSSEELLNEDFRRLVNIVRTYPGVESASIVGNAKPWFGSYSGYQVMNPEDSTKANIQAYQYPAGSDYFKTYRLRSALDHKWESLSEMEIPSNGIVISEDTRRSLFGDAPAIGKTLIVNKSPLVVSGVVDMVKRFPTSFPNQCIFYPVTSLKKWMFEDNYAGIVIRMKPGVSEKALLENFPKEMSSKLDIGNLYFSDMRAYSELGKKVSDFDDSTRTLQLRTILSTFFLIVVFLGVISTFWLRAETRREEIGLRMAIGSTSGKIRRRLIAESLLLTLFSSFIGLIIMINIAYYKGMYSFGSSKLPDFWPVNSPVPHFIFVTIITLVLLIAVVAIATAVPASRAASVKPVEALRDE